MISLSRLITLTRRIAQKITRTPGWLGRKVASQCRWTAAQLVWLLTERYWLIDYLPKGMRDNNLVLLVRLDLIGDFIVWLDSAKEFRNLYPNKRIVLYANSSWAALAQELLYWDEVVSIDVPRLRTSDFYRLQTLVKTHHRGFNVAIQPTYSREYVGDLVIRATQAKQRIGHVGDNNNIISERKALSDTWYTRLIHKIDFADVEFSLNAHLIRELGISSFESNVPVMPLLAELPAQLKIEEPYCVIVPGASWAPKTWPIEHFAEVAQKIHARYGLKIVLCGTKSEQSTCRQLAQMCDSNVVDFSGKTTLVQLVELIRDARLVVTNDSSAVHIAAATDTNAVCVVGGGHYGRFLPYKLETPFTRQRLPLVLNEYMNCYGCRWRCEYLTPHTQLVPCVANVSPDRVMNACTVVLNDLAA